LDNAKGILKTREHDLTIEEVRSVPSFAQFSDEQIQEVIDAIKQLSLIAFNIYKHQDSARQM